MTEVKKYQKFCLLFFLLGIALGFSFSFFLNFSKNEAGDAKEIRLNQGFKYTNPLLECELDDSASHYSLSSLEKKIKSYIYQKIKEDNGLNEAAVYFRDLNNGLWFGINEDLLFSPASLIKVPMMMVYFKAAEKNPAILQQKITNNIENGYDNQNFFPLIKLEKNKEYSAWQLIEQMIIYSDNVAYLLLYDSMDKGLLEKVYEDLGVDVTQGPSNSSGIIITIKDYSNFFRILYNASYLEKKYSEASLEMLTKTVFKKGLTAGIPAHLKTAHKFGERNFVDTGEKQFHDCGIIYYPSRPYLLCIMTKGSNFDFLIRTIQDISRQIYQNIAGGKFSLKG